MPDATKLTYPEETCRTDVAYVLVETKIHEIVTPRRRTCSLAVTVSAPSRKPGPQPARSERLCFVPVQSSSVLSVLSFRRFADIQWPMSVMQSSNCAAMSQRLQCTYSYELVFKSAVDYYRRNSSHVFCCFIDFKKAFDQVDYWLLFCKLLDSNNSHGYWHFGTAINKFSFAGKIPIHSVLIWLEVSDRVEYCHHIYLNCM